ncbi:MAG: S41 family peptidase [Prevotella sp.]|jgi:carboxyl-terminal processing protease|nr:S41 family peptidase [Prevotella sp.]
MKRVIIAALCFLTIVASASAQFKMSEGSKKVATTMAIIENLYVDDVNDQKLAEDAIKSLLEKLDPHSTYISTDEVKDMNEPLEGNFDGIGISFNMMTDTLYVIEALPGGPSEKAGLMAGDKILYVNDTLIAGVKRSTKYVMSRLKGPKGTKVDVKVLRRGVPELLDFKITRAKIPVYSIDASYMVDNNTGYIRIIRFGATTTKEFQDALAKLKKEGMKNLILDLEGNGGGYMAPAIDLSDEFLSKGKLIVYTEGLRQPRRDEVSTEKGSFEDGKVVIMINEGSASASEILSGAVQDWDRGVIVGRRSFGKGLVQRQIPLPDESMIRLTVARYYTPTGRSIQKPYTNGDLTSYNMDVIERYNKGEMMHADSIHFPDSLKYTTLMSHRTVYGGGGIMPDYFVPLDTTNYTPYFRSIANRGLIYKVAYGEVDNHRKDILDEYPTKESFLKKYIVPQSLLEKIVAAGEEEKITYNEDEFNKASDLIRMQLKMLLARDIFDTETSLKIYNGYSETFKKAYEIIHNDNLYNSLLKGKN